MTFSDRQLARRTVLVVDDEFVNRQLLGMILSEEYEVLYAENGREALEILREKQRIISLVLLDLLMPEIDGFTVLQTIRADEALRHIPVIVLTSEKTAEVRSLRLGAADFITKPYDLPEVILARVLRIIELTEGRMIIQSAEKDDLTGLYTGAFFIEYVHRMERYHPERVMDAMVLNIEHFHLINDMYGRDFGNKVLANVARGIGHVIDGREAIACRKEADTFYIYCEHRDDYGEMVETIRERLSGTAGNIRLRLGVYPEVEVEMGIERVFDRANLACNTLRGNYTRSVAIYDKEMYEKELFSERLINDLHKAIEEKQFKIYYQPKYDIRAEEPRLRAAEALIRWQHPEFGMVGPGAFIPLFESNGLIQLVDQYVWREAAAQIAAWRERFGVTLPVSVNVSRVDIYDPKLEELLLDIVETNALKPEDLHLEVTESAYTEDPDQLIGVVTKLREKGFRIEMDDFGSGYSSLNMLSVLPIDVLKMDMKFIQKAKERKGLRMVELVMDIAKYLDAPVVAEGVETAEQCALLQSAGCDMVQGFFFSRPVPPEEFERFFGGN